MTISELVERERESAVRAGHLCVNLAFFYRQTVETGHAQNPMAAALMSQRCSEAAKTITLALRAFGMSQNDIMALAEEIDRERVTLETLKDAS